MKYFLISVIFFLAAMAIDLRPAFSEDVGANSSVTEKLASLEKKVNNLKSKQSAMAENQSRMKEEIANLKVWIHRR